MPITTYLSRDTKSMVTSGDKDIDEWLSELRKVSNVPETTWLIDFVVVKDQRRLANLFGLFGLKPDCKLYTLYYDYLGDGIEHQIINFCGDTEWSINTYVKKSTIINYLIGYVSGIESARRKS